VPRQIIEQERPRRRAGRSPGPANMLERPAFRTLRALKVAEAECTRCPLYKNATQVVPGEGAVNARIMLVGEQPGDKEDRAGKPFVGPAGLWLDRALKRAGIGRTSVFVTNAVKHFKFEPRGKRRLHKRPNAYEIDRCHWWYENERRIVRPRVTVALGATGARAVLGRPTNIGRSRGKVMPLEDGVVIVTIHPSWLLRIREDSTRQKEFEAFVKDLILAREAAAAR
jgi:uracil-DNA glycosylase family protein